jgi:hypothetical protein
MDDLTLDQRVQLIEQFERSKPRTVQAAVRKAVVLLGLAAAVLGFMILVGIGAVSRLQQERARLRVDVGDLNRLKRQALEERDAATRTRDAILAETARAREALDALRLPTTSAAARQTALANADDDLASAYIVGRSAQMAAEFTEAPPRAELIRRLYSREPNERLRAYGALVQTSRRDPTVVPELLRFAADPDARADRANGIYNTLVLLSQIDADALVPHAREVRRFANSVRSLGPRTAARAAKLIARLPPQSSP